MEQAIKKAMEGGYNADLDPSVHGVIPTLYTSILLDPLFWQALGKALGWSEFNDQCPVCESMDTLGGYTWTYQMHRFIDALIAGQTPDSFFDALLNTK